MLHFFRWGQTEEFLGMDLYRNNPTESHGGRCLVGERELAPRLLAASAGQPLKLDNMEKLSTHSEVLSIFFLIKIKDAFSLR